ncbi:hypothetical protein ACLB2K_040141 [Fragaria x ananassa]
MVDEVSRLAAALAISENGKVSFGATVAAAFTGYSYAVGRLMSLKKKVEPRAFMATMGVLWGLRNRLMILPQGDRYVLQFKVEADCKDLLENGPWFYGKTVFALAKYDERSDAASVPITFVPVLVEVFSLPMDLWMKKALYMVGKERSDYNHAHFQVRAHVGFCRVCGLLEHCPGGCQDPLNMSEAVLRSGEGSRANPNPNPNLSSANGVTNLFPASGFILSKPGVSAAQLTAYLHFLQNATVEENGVAKFRHVLELSLPHLVGTLVISPPKKHKVGRPYGSKNKPRVVEINPWKLEAKSSNKRSFGSVSTTPEVMAVEAIEDPRDVPYM